MKTALIAGPSGMIGLELVRHFLDAGFVVYGLDLKGSKNF